MENYSFKAYSFCNEINFNEIARRFGIENKYKWEEFLTLSEEHLKGVINNWQGKKVKIFHFGSIVFINMVYNEMMDVINYLKKIEKNLEKAEFTYNEDYEFEISENEFEITYDKMVCTLGGNIDIISIILAKSVSLERVEAEIEKIIDDSEEIIALLEKAKISIKDRKITKMTADILKFKHSTISYIMLLDKPDVTWKNQEADEIYMELSHIFELDERYKKIQSKSETLMDIVGVFSSFMQSKRGNRLEITVIILIAVEILIMLSEIFKT